MIFAQPLWLILVPLLAAGGYGFWKLARRRAEKRIGLFVSPALAREAVPSMDWPLRAARFALPAAIVALVAVAAARPLTGPKPGHAERRGVDFVVALDVSKSMWAEDLQPNRLAAVKNELETWLKQASGDRMGLVLFAGDAIVQAPITFDYQALDRVLKVAAPKAISKGGTNIGAAIQTSGTLLAKAGLDTRALVIISDGENLDGDAVDAARKARARDGITIFTVGVGSATGGKVPLTERAEFDKLPPERRQKRNYMRNEYGTEVVSRLDENALRAIASAGGGQYIPFAANGEFFQKLRHSHLLPLAKNRKILNVQDYNEWFQVPLFLAIVLLMLEPLIPASRKRPADHGAGVAVIRPEETSGPAGAPVKFAKRTGKRPAAVPLLLLLAAAQAAPGNSPLHQQVDQLIKDKKPAEAVALIKAEADRAPQDPLLAYNYGLTLYQAGQFEEAIIVFQNLRNTAEDDGIRARALFQLGNAQFRLGRKLGNQPAAALSMERAMSFYDELLTIKSSSDGRQNHEAAKLALQDILRQIAADRLRSADEQLKRNDTQRLSRTLTEALEAQDKLVALDPKDRQAAKDAGQTRQRLVDSLLGDAEKHSAETDRIESQKGPDWQIMNRRNQALEMLNQADTQAPDDRRVDEAIQRENSKISNYMTRKAEEKMAPVLAKEKRQNGDWDALERGRQELTQALELDPNNAKAAELKKQAGEILEKETADAGEQALAHAQKSGDPRNRLRAATNAAGLFQRTQAVNPDNGKAKAGLEKLATLLPELHAAAAELDLAEGKKQLAADDSQASLKKAVGNLESAAQNFARASAMKPGDQDIEQGLQEAQRLLSESRDQLDVQRQASAQPERPQDQDGEPGANQQNASPPHAPKTQVYSQTRKAPPSVTSGNFWNKNVRDW